MTESQNDHIEREIEVGTDAYDITDFSNVNSIKTGKVKRCIAIVAYSQQPLKGGIFHMTVFGNPDRWCKLVCDNFINSQTKIHVFGGDSVSKEKLISVPLLLQKHGFSVNNEGLWQGNTINNIVLKADGTIEAS